MLFIVHEADGTIALYFVADAAMRNTLRGVNGCSWNGKGKNLPAVEELWHATDGSGDLSKLSLQEYTPGDEIKEVVTFFSE